MTMNLPIYENKTIKKKENLYQTKIDIKSVEEIDSLKLLATG